MGYKLHDLLKISTELAVLAIRRHMLLIASVKEMYFVLPYPIRKARNHFQDLSTNQEGSILYALSGCTILTPLKSPSIFRSVVGATAAIISPIRGVEQAESLNYSPALFMWLQYPLPSAFSCQLLHP